MSRISMWGAAIAAWLVAAAAEAQTVGSSTVPQFEDTMTTGLVPLFGFVLAGIVVMTLATIVTTFVLRPRFRLPKI